MRAREIRVEKAFYLPGTFGTRFEQADHDRR
jgi:hypothetical protein